MPRRGGDGCPQGRDTWHGRTVTLDADWARFTEVDLDEARSRLARYAELYRLQLTNLSTGDLDRPRPTAWTIRQITHHVADVVYYARQVGDLTTHHAATNADADFVFTEWDRRTRAGDIDGLLELYTEDARFESPLVARILDQTSGMLRGHDQLREFFERGAGPPTAAAARDLHPLRRSTTPSFVQRALGIAGVRGQPEVRPANPPRVPSERLWLFTEKVDPELGSDAVGRRAT